MLSAAPRGRSRPGNAAIKDKVVEREKIKHILAKRFPSKNALFFDRFSESSQDGSLRLFVSLDLFPSLSRCLLRCFIWGRWHLLGLVLGGALRQKVITDAGAVHEEAVPSLTEGSDDALVTPGANLHSVTTLGQAHVQRKADGLGAVVDEDRADSHEYFFFISQFRAN